MGADKTKTRDEMTTVLDVQRVRTGDQVMVAGLAGQWFEVVDASDDRVLTLGASGGATMRVGRHIVTEIAEVWRA